MNLFKFAPEEIFTCHIRNTSLHLGKMNLLKVGTKITYRYSHLARRLKLNNIATEISHQTAKLINSFRNDVCSP